MKLDEILSYIIEETDKELPFDKKESMMQMKFCELHNLHFSVGLWIRNHFFLSESLVCEEFQKLGVVCDDDLSTMIVQLYYLHLKSKNTPKS